MPKRWRMHAHDADAVAALARSARVPTFIARLLWSRGIREPQAVERFLRPRLADLREPQLLPGVEEAVARVAAAIAAGERITIYGDYDVDGITATSILWQCLKLLGADVGYFVPCRLEDGYGLSDDALERLAAQGTRLVVTVDCGIASISEARRARQLGLDLVVTDHHQLADELPEAAAVVHPRLPGTAYPFGELSGSGVALKLAWALCQHASGARRVTDRLRDFLVSAVGLASLGTIADVVPLVDENRVLVQHGLTSLPQSPSRGVRALLEVTRLQDKQVLDAEDVAFTLAPRLNAAGRLGQAQLGVELLTTTSAEKALELAQYLNSLNEKRQQLERSIQLAASQQAKRFLEEDDPPALVLADHDWHRGVIGIVAGRLAEKHHRPVIVVALDPLPGRPAVGSARSVPGFDLHAALSACGEHLVSYGGHAAAAGLKLDAARLDAFRADFCEVAARELGPTGHEAELWIDDEVPLAALTAETVGILERMGPFGHSNPRPMFRAAGVRLAEPPKRMGEGGRHLALRLEQGGVALRAVSFGNGDWVDALSAAPGPISIAFRPVINAFRGRRNVELHVADWLAAGAPASVGV